MSNRFKAFISFALILLMAFTLAITSISAADGSFIIFESVTVTSTGDNNTTNISQSDDKVNITATAKAKKETGWCGTEYLTQSIKMTVINDRTDIDVEMVVTFNNTGSLVINENNINASESVYKLSNGDKVVITLTSGEDDNTSQVNLKFKEISHEISSEVSIQKTANGSFEVDGVKSEDLIFDSENEYHVTASYNPGLALNAIPDSGYKFVAWADINNKIISRQPNFTYQPESDITIRPIFEELSSSTPLFEVGNNQFVGLEAADTFASSSVNKTIVLLNNAILSAGEYVISSGNTLLIPFDDEHTLYTTNPEHRSINADYKPVTAYRTLTMATGSKIIVNGEMSLSAKYHSPNGGQPNAGSPSGPVSFVKMDEGSNIVVNEGATLYAWGYITGKGNVTINSGADVYEYFQIMDFRGGSKTTSVAGSGKGVFVISQYYIQNVEVPMYLYAGASEHSFTSIYMSSSVMDSSVEFMGSSGSMFNLKNGYIIKDYDEKTDRLIIEGHGDVDMSGITMKIGSTSIDSKKFVLPINSNISLIIKEGSTIQLDQDICMLPGSSIEIEKDATCVLGSGKNFYVYDSDQWGNYVFYYGVDQIFAPLTYAPGREYTRTAANLIDASILVNGTVDASKGSVYTTEGGANVYSTESGIIKTKPGNKSSTQQYIQKEDRFVSIPITPIKLRNDINQKLPYTITANDSDEATYIYNSFAGMWMKEGYSFVIWENYDGSFLDSASVDLTTLEGKEASSKFSGETPTKDQTDDKTFTFDKWEEISNENNVIVYRAKYTEETRKYTVTWVDSDGASLGSSEVEYGQMPTPPSNPTKESTKKYTYTFSGWDKKITTVTENVTYRAVYTETVNKYKVTWADDVGNEIYSEMVEYDTVPTYVGDNPIKNATPKYTYTFNGWGNVVKVTDDVTYKAVFDETINKYAITWKQDNGDIIDITQVEYDSKPSYPDPTKTPTERVEFVFDGWTPDIINVTGPAEYTATYIETDRLYTVTWKNADGTVLRTDDLKYEAVPNFGSQPTLASTAEFTYSFMGWDNEVVPVTEDVTYTAQYNAIKNKYTIEFINDDGTELQSRKVAYGETPAYTGETPTKAEDAQYTYTFAGWDKEVVAVTGNTTYKATYTSVVNKYKIKFYDEDRTTLLKELDVEYGATPEYGESPTKEATAKYTYTFDGWSPALEEVRGEASYFAKYKETLNEYTVTWVDGDGKETKQTVQYGTIPTFNGTPTKTATAKYTYTFARWDNEIVAVTGDVTYTAQFTETVNKYTVKWVNGEQTLKTEEVEYGNLPTRPSDPTKTSDAKYTYTFAGWSPEVNTVTGDVTYTATYSQTVNKYIIKFVNEDGTELQSSEVAYGETPVYSGETPTKAADAQYTYTWLGWTPEVESVTGEATYKATYSSTVNTYTVTWVDEDGTVLETDENVPYGTTPSFNGEDPIKEADAQYTYAWSGWTPEINDVTGNVTYTATYSKTINKYTIKFVNEDGTELQSSEVAFGETPAYTGETPTKTPTAQYTYVFAGWTPNVDTVKGDATYTATYTATTNKYTVTWKNHNGNVLETDENVEYGTMPSYDGENPTKEGNAQYSYKFKGWSPAVNSVTGDVTYTAEFNQVINKYTIAFVDEDGTELQSSEVAYGETPEYTGETPTKAATAQYTYTFAGWTPQVTSVTGAATYTATYTSEVNEYTITFKNEDGTVLQSSPVAYGETPIYNGQVPTKAATAQYTYTFDGWDSNPETVTGDAIYTATFSSTLNEYTIKFLDKDGTELQNSKVAYGDTPEYKGATPTKAPTAQYTYEFAGWSPEVVSVTGEATYTATYSSTLRSYTVTWLDEDGTVLETDTEVPYGDTPTYDGETPTKEATAQYTFTFADWTPSVDKVTGDVTYTATYTSTTNTYTVTWVDEDGTELEVDTDVPYGTTPKYDKANPTKENTEEFTYVFTGWTPSISTVTGDVKYTATYGQQRNSYTIQFLNYDGTLLQELELEYGSEVSYTGETPVKLGDTQFSYEFIGWDKTIVDVVDDATYTAQFKEVTNKYLIKWLGVNNQVLFSQEVEYGKTPVYGGTTPTKQSDEEYTYTFKEWSPEVTPVTKEATYEATFNAIKNQYTVTFKNEDGTVLQTQRVEYGTVPQYTGAEPTKAATAQYTYAFAGWDKEVVEVTGDVIYTATYTSTTNKYTVTWKNWNGDVLGTTEVEYGTTPSYDGETPTKAADAQYTYTFAGWTPSFSAVEGNVTYTATYSTVLNKYTITWINWDGEVLGSDEVEYGTVPTYKGETPLRPADAQYTYTFANFGTITAVDGDETYTAQYNATVNKYTVTWNNYDGTTLETDIEIPYGQQPSYNGVTPIKPSNAQYTYAWSGWTPEIDKITGDVTYTATFTATVNKYTVTWINGETVLETDTEVEYGTTPNYDGETPTKAADAQYTYTFAGWSPEVNEVTGNVTYTATFTSTVNKYTVTWMNGETVLETDTEVEYGSEPSYDSELPTKAADAQYTYTFAGWSPEVNTVTGNVTYTATFNETLRSYTITFVNEDGTVLQSSDVVYGSTPLYTGVVPTKAADAQYTYAFAGWTPEVKSVTGEATYKATYNSTVNRYTVTWTNENGTVLETDMNVEYGATPNYDGSNPTKVPTAEYTYAFAGWTPSVDVVTGNVTYKATFTGTKNQYTVTFLNENGTVLQSGKVEYGVKPEYASETPTKESTKQYTYTFAGWDKEVVEVTGEVTYRATYNSAVNKYTVTWINWDGSELGSEEVEYGTVPNYKGTEPTKAADAQYTYTFSGFGTLTAVEEDVTYTARYTSTVNKYLITWVDEDGTELFKEEVEYGKLPTYGGKTPTKAADAQCTYAFAGWTPAVKVVNGETTYTATYTSTVNIYTVTFQNEDGRVLQTLRVEYGTMPEFTGSEPTKAKDVQYTYTFKGWDKEVVEVTENVIYTATYSTTTNQYSVTWADDRGNKYYTEMVEYGKVPTYTGETPVKEETDKFSYTFAGWDKEVVEVTGNVEYRATFTSTINKYTITFVNENGTILYSEDVEYDTVPEYKGETPTKDSNAQYTFTFAGWTPRIDRVTGEATYTATYTSTVNAYTVTWKNWDGTVLETDTNVAYGVLPNYGSATPTKDKDVQYTYTFKGWDTEVSPVTGDVVYTATFDATLNKYSIIFYIDEQEIKLTQDYGTPIVAPEVPPKTGYTFAGWDIEVPEVMTEEEYIITATWSINVYNISWDYDGDGVADDVTSVNYNEIPSHLNATRNPTAEYTYVFESWDREIERATEDTMYTAIYKEYPNRYVVTLDANGGSEVVAEATLYYGHDFVLPTTTREGYTFLGWDIDGDGVADELPETMPAHNMSATAQWQINSYTVRFETSGGTVIDPISGVYGTAMTAPEDPTRVGYTFVRWDKDIPTSIPAENMTINAVWRVNQYTITFNTDGGTEIDPITLNYGTSVVAPENPTKDRYTFLGWDKEIPTTMPAEDMTITAKWQYTYTGWISNDRGNTYLKDGATAYTNTWATIEGNKYYFDEFGYAITGLNTIPSDDGSYTGTFVFDKETGAFLNTLSGVYEEAGDIYYLQDGEVLYGLGLTRVVKENGDVRYYYFGDDGKAIKNTSLDLTSDDTMGLLPEDTYTFNELGVIPHDEDTSKNGIHKDGSDKYYYIDGIKVYMGLFKVGDDYYYATTGGKLITTQTYRIRTRNNGLLSNGLYDFNTAGKIILSSDIERHYGDDRYLTAFGAADALKAELGVDKFNAVIIATGESYPDALTGSYLANKLNAPILLTVDYRQKEVINYVNKNVKSGGKVYILGGENAVSKDLDNALAGYNVIRLAGEDRYATNLAILKEAGVKAGDDILIATGHNYADSLSASSTGKAIMLVDTWGLSNTQKEFLAGLNKKSDIYILGGDKAVTTTAESYIKNYGTVHRINGSTRCETSAMIAETFFEDVEKVVLTTAWNFPDGLAGGPLGYAMNAPIILTSSDSYDYKYAKDYLNENMIKEGIVLGGSKLVSDNATRTIFNVSESTKIEVNHYK